MLSFLIAANRADKVKALVPFQGFSRGKDVTLIVHPSTGHAFMGPHNAAGGANPGAPPRVCSVRSCTSTAARTRLRYIMGAVGTEVGGRQVAETGLTSTCTPL